MNYVYENGLAVGYMVDNRIILFTKPMPQLCTE